ncbi:MAG TPA: UDP-2,3-diacylglucosamine diphosphatase [Burkholderiales bacterium]|nr:UDP-2,3-diacylglucosamine diphosphatase [Burkholderiales bacterium]
MANSRLDLSDNPGARVNRYRSIWISDIHLGTPGCQAAFPLDFLRHNESDHLYLVGDVIDGWQLKRRWYWTQAHNDVVQKVLRKARKGTRVTYIAGNHDEALRQFIHKPQIKTIDGVVYCNDGDWVESLSALVETFEGELRIVQWRRQLRAPAAQRVELEEEAHT